MVLAFSVVPLIAGIITIAAPKSKGGGIAAGVFYLIAALIGFVSLGTYNVLKIWVIDLVIWVVIAVMPGIVFIIGSTNITRPARK